MIAKFQNLSSLQPFVKAYPTRLRTMDNEIYEDSSIYPDPEEYSRFSWLGGNDHVSPDEFLSITRGPIVHEGFVPHENQNGFYHGMVADNDIGLESSELPSNDRLNDRSEFADNRSPDTPYSLSEESSYISYLKDARTILICLQ